MNCFLEIRFIYTKGLVSDLITWNSNSLFDHTEGKNRAGDKWVGAHAGTGIDARSLDWCTPARERRYRLPVTEAQYASAMAYMESKIGTSYDYADIFGLALHNRHFESADRIICSAFMFNWLLAAGIQALNVLPSFSYLVTPETLHLSPTLIGNCIYTKE